MSRLFRKKVTKIYVFNCKIFSNFKAVMDLDHFLKRTGRTKADLLREMNLDPTSSLIASYIKERAYPPYDKILKLIELGITADELLGKEHAEMLMFNSQVSPEEAKSIFDSPEFRKNVEKILAEIQNKSSISQKLGESDNLLDRMDQDDIPRWNK